jgi:hypothetical protein
VIVEGQKKLKYGSGDFKKSIRCECRITNIIILSNIRSQFHPLLIYVSLLVDKVTVEMELLKEASQEVGVCN